MIEPERTFDVEAVIKDPAAHFARPADVVRDVRLTLEQKQRILNAWAVDAELLSQAETENMSGTSPPRLREVKLALLELEQER